MFQYLIVASFNNHDHVVIVHSLLDSSSLLLNNFRDFPKITFLLSHNLIEQLNVIKPMALQ